MNEQQQPSSVIVDWRDGLKRLQGLPLRGSALAGSTRSFYFGEILNSTNPCQFTEFVLSPDCAWRIDRGPKTLVGSGDYDLDESDPDCVEALKNGFRFVSRQCRLLRMEFGDERRANWLKFRYSPKVTLVEHDEFGGFVLGLESDIRITVFPNCTERGQWNILGVDTFAIF